MSNMPKKKDDEKGMHDGHRKRLIDTVDKVGIDNVSSIQAMEYILFFVFPRGDVNPLAHRLLDKFHDVPTVLEASIEDLKVVKGMGETSAKKLRSLLDIFFYYSQEKLSGKTTLKTIGEFYDYIDQLLRYHTVEELYLFGVNPFGEVTKGRRFEKGTFNMVKVDYRDLALYVSTHRVNSLILVHNHPNGSCFASAQDEESYEKMKKMFTYSGCLLYDSIIVGIDGIYSMEKKSMQRIFNTNAEDVQKILQELKQKTTQ